MLEHWAVAYECVHEPEHALAKLWLAAAESPSAPLYVNIARNQIMLQREQDAIQSLDRALQLDASMDSAYVMRGELYESQGILPTAAHDYWQALQLNPQNEQAQLRLQTISGYAIHR